MEQLRVCTTGGTIASTVQDGAATPTESGDALVESVPGFGKYRVSVHEVTRRGSVEMDFETMAELAEEIRNLAPESDGIVVTHGTDTMEETAYFLDLTLDIDTPVVLTGAQRQFDAVSPDGPANLLLGARVATNREFSNCGGVYVAFNDEVHTARHVTKSHTTRLDTFESPEFGPVATASADRLRTLHQPGSRSVSVPVTSTDARVAMVKSAVAVDETPIERALEAGVDGLVVEATGVGNVSPGIAEGIYEALDADIPVVIVSRCHEGSVVPKYGGECGSQSLHDAGVIFADSLPAHKARVKLSLVLATESDTSDVVTYF